MKRIFSFILCLVMIASLACPAYAEEPENETAGEIPAEEVILDEIPEEAEAPEELEQAEEPEETEIPDVPEENEEPEQAEAPAEEEPKAEKTIENETFDADGSVVINATNFPDSVFRKYVSDNFDRDGSGSLSATELGSISSIDVDGLGISSLKGIKFFKNLSSIHCKDNNLSSLDVSNNTALTELWCSSNNLRSMDVSNNTALTNLNCRENALTSLDVSKNTALTELDFCENELTEIDVSRNTALDYLHCAGNNIEHLDLSRNTALKYLFCYENDLTGLDLSHNNALLRLQCIGDNLSMLDISNTKVCTDSDLYGYFGQQQSGSVKVSMTEAQKACYDANFAQAYQNAGVVVKVAAAKPAITTQPANVSGAVGSSVKVSVKAEGEGLTYQWQYRTSSTGSWNSSP